MHLPNAIFFSLNRAVFDNYVAVPDSVTGHDGAGLLWDIVCLSLSRLVGQGFKRRPAFHF